MTKMPESVGGANDSPNPSHKRLKIQVSQLLKKKSTLQDIAAPTLIPAVKKQNNR